MNDHDVYRVAWSDEDGEYVATVDRFPSLSWLSTSPVLALHGLVELVVQVDDARDGHHPCYVCNTPWSTCMDPSDGGQCCAECFHPYQCADRGAANAIVDRVAPVLTNPGLPLGGVRVRPSDSGCGGRDD
jgi:hypothetical protein